jgi:hypothetical protein
LYFALTSKEIPQKRSSHTAALTGFGFEANGGVRIPENAALSDDIMAVIDDAAIPAQDVNSAEIEKLASFCSQAGCFLDFVKPVSAFHVAVILGIRRLLPQMPLWIPARYHHFAPEALCVVTQVQPCNHWERFVQRMQKTYGKWCLEVTPWNAAFFLPKVKNRAGYLQHSCCNYAHDGELCRYFDTSDTLKQKLALAEAHGCAGAIGLYRELTEL